MLDPTFLTKVVAAGSTIKITLTHLVIYFIVAIVLGFLIASA
jgi:hypothetical protein